MDLKSGRRYLCLLLDPLAVRCRLGVCKVSRVGSCSCYNFHCQVTARSKEHISFCT